MSDTNVEPAVETEADEAAEVEFEPLDEAGDEPALPPPAKPRLPTVAIVGRPNVGKSSLLNALARKRVAIVQDMPGVTRDRVSIPFEIDGKWLEIVDTGGYGFDDEQGLSQHIKDQIETAMKRSDLTLFVVDAHSGLLPADETIADLLRRIHKPVLLVANKADGDKHDLSLADFARLGFGTPVGISATTNRNINRLIEAISARIDLSDAPTEEPSPDLKVAIVGKRNAGKSTLVNAIARAFTGEEGEQGDDRVIVSEVAGTTRDSVDVYFEKDGRTMVVIDTAGVRKKRHMVTDDIEFFSYHRAQRSIRRADVVLLLIDATGKVSDPDKKLSAEVVLHEKPTVIVVNKWDLAKEELRKAQKDAKKPIDERELMEQYREYLDAELRGLSYAPTAFITAKDGKNVPALLDLCRHLHKVAGERVTTGQLNAALSQAMEERTPGGKRGGKKRPKVFYATQVAMHPPHLVLFVNDPALFDESYRRFLLNRFRDLLPFEEIPMRLTLRARSRTETDAHGKPHARRRPVAEVGEPAEKPGRSFDRPKSPPKLPGTQRREQRPNKRPK